MKSNLNIQTGSSQLTVPKNKPISPDYGKKRVLTITNFFDQTKGQRVYQTQYQEIDINVQLNGEGIEVARNIAEPPSNEDLRGLLGETKEKGHTKNKWFCC